MPIEVAGCAVVFEPSELLRDRPFVRVAELTVGGDTATVRLALPIEGVFGRLSLQRRAGAWTIVESEFVERRP